MFFRRIAGRPVARGEAGFLPTVSIIIPAYNEAELIGEKLTNLRKLEYPQESMQVVVVSDGSTNGTDAVRQAAGNEFRITAVLLAERVARQTH